jgi:hypothetical protein
MYTVKLEGFCNVVTEVLITASQQLFYLKEG